MSDESATAAAAFLVLCYGYKLLLKKKKPRQRRWWITSVNNSRKKYNGSDLLIDMVKEPSTEFFNFCRMSREDFQYLLDSVGPVIYKRDTKWRKAIPIQERLAITLRFLATGDSFQSLHYLFKVSPQIISEIVPEVCRAIIDVLMNHIKLPNTAEEWKSVAKHFDNMWNFPHCLGALDGKHITLQCPINSGSEYFNYKTSFSIVLMALVDAQYCFTFVDCGCQGRVSDGGVYRNTKLYNKISSNQLNIPPPEPLPGRPMPIPYVIVADDAFEFSPALMKPYRGVHNKGSKERAFNYRISRARRVVENAFGILASVFRVFRKPMLLQPEKASLITMTCVLLHNFLRRSKTSQSVYTPPGTFDNEENGVILPGTWRQDHSPMSSLLPMQQVPRKHKGLAEEIRGEFSQYFVNNGKVLWQDEYA